MGRHVIIRLGGPFEAEWLVQDESGQILQGPARGTLQSAAAEARGSRVSVLVPGVDVLLTRASVPTMNRQRLLKAIPYALEDQLAGDVESLHFALGRPDDGGLQPVAVATRQRMDEWLEALGTAGIGPSLMTPDTLAVPWREACWSILLAGEIALVRTGAQDGFAVEADGVLPLLSLQLASADDGRPSGIDLYVAGPGAPVVDAFSELGVPVSEHAGEQGILKHLAEGLADHEQINLLQDAYGPEERFVQLLRPWRATGAIAAAWFILLMAGSFIDTWQLEQERRALGERMQQVFREAFPEVRRVVDPKLQMQRRLAELRKDRGTSQAGFLPLLAAGAESLQRVEGVEIQGLQYRQGRLELDLTLANMSGLDPLRQALQQAGGLNASVVSARAREGVVEGKIRITGKQG